MKVEKSVISRDESLALARKALSEAARLKTQVLQDEGFLGSLLAASLAIADCFAAGGKLLLCGNGGSAADCQHMAAELTSRLTKDFERPGLPAIALTTDTSFLTAYTNDCGYEGVFARQVEALGKAGDVLLGISTSGDSANVVRAVSAAERIGMGTIALVGAGGRLASMASVAILVPSRETPRIQEVHLAVEHIVCEIVERRLFAGND